MAAAAAAAVKRRHEVEAAIAAGDISPLTPEAPVQRRSSLPDAGLGLWKFQRKVAVAYRDVKSQMLVASLISANFLVNIIEKWIDPYGDSHPDLWRATDLFFNILFFIELMVNMYAFWWVRFWSSAWNWFDTLVVSIGVLDIFQVPLPGPLSLLRMMRAFRVFRLFKRVQSLKKILDSLGKALPSHINSFFILLLVMSIYSILAVEFFMNYATEGYYVNNLNETVEFRTARDQTYGQEYFGNFGLSLFTMFQVLTGDSWSEVVARPLVTAYDDVVALGSVVYFVSFQLVCGIVLINVTIAVLLEKMVDDGSEKMEEAQRARALAEESELLGIDGLDPAEAVLAKADGLAWEWKAPETAETVDTARLAPELAGVLAMEKEVAMLRHDMSVLKKGLKDVLVALSAASGEEVPASPMLQIPAMRMDWSFQSVSDVSV
mmetsp:Transcript_96141/g.228996  ORF Transcript_96141/g.228996 Transcript_96141/m.228996 type:complete len:434 (-) Transcript_96141:93-1394(-)